MWSTMQRKRWKLSANSAFCLVFLISGLLLLLLHAQFGQQPHPVPIKSPIAFESE